MAKCPHADIARCPLYVAAHQPGAPTCMRKDWDTFGGCDVDQGVDYAQLLGALMAQAPRLVAQVEWNTRLAESRAQRDRNLRLNGVH